MAKVPSSTSTGYPNKIIEYHNGTNIPMEVVVNPNVKKVKLLSHMTHEEIQTLIRKKREKA
jgi:hypothetical protein